MRQTNFQAGLIAGIFLIGALLWVSWFFIGEQQTQPVELTATVLSTPKPLPAFSLTDQRGQTFNQETFKGKWSYVFFGYTFCPDICPTTMTLLNQVNSLVNDDVQQPEIVFVSVDPDRDTQDKLAEYVGFFNPDFIGLTGDVAQIKTLASTMGIAFRKSQEMAGDQYLVDHSAAILLIDPQARVRALISPPHDAKIMADEYAMIVSAYSG